MQICFYLLVIAFGVISLHLAVHQNTGFHERLHCMWPNFVTIPPAPISPKMGEFHTNGWLYFELQSAWYHLGLDGSKLCLRSISVLSSLASLFAFYVWGWRLGGRSLGLCCAFLMACNTFFLGLSVFDQFNALNLLLVLLSFIFLQNACCSRRWYWWLCFALAMLAAIATTIPSGLLLLVWAGWVWGNRQHLPAAHKLLFSAIAVIGIAFALWMLSCDPMAKERLFVTIRDLAMVGEVMLKNGSVNLYIPPRFDWFTAPYLDGTWRAWLAQGYAVMASSALLYLVSLFAWWKMLRARRKGVLAGAETARTGSAAPSARYDRSGWSYAGMWLGVALVMGVALYLHFAVRPCVDARNVCWLLPFALLFVGLGFQRFPAVRLCFLLALLYAPGTQYWATYVDKYETEQVYAYIERVARPDDLILYGEDLPRATYHIHSRQPEVLTALGKAVWSSSPEWLAKMAQPVLTSGFYQEGYIMRLLAYNPKPWAGRRLWVVARGDYSPRNQYMHSDRYLQQVVEAYYSRPRAGGPRCAHMSNATHQAFVISF